MCFQLFCGRETYTVDTLQHLVLAVTFPVSTGVTDQFEMFTEFYVVYVRSTTEVGKVSLIVNGDISVFQICDQIQFVRIIGEHFQCFFFGNFTANDLFAGFYHFFHLFCDLFNVLITDHIIAKIDIIIESFRNNRSNPELCLWIQMFDCLSHHMGAGMVQCF